MNLCFYGRIDKSGYSHQPFTLELAGSNPATLTIILRNAEAKKQGVVMGLLVEPLPDGWQCTNKEGITAFHN